MSKTLITAAVAATAIMTGAIGSPPVQAAAWGAQPALAAQPGYQKTEWRRGACYAGERDCNARWRWERNHRRHLVWREGRYYDDDTGAALAGGILGFALGAAIAGSSNDYDYYAAHRYDRGWRGRCRDLPGFDWRSGTFIGRDGYRHYCVR